MLVIFREQPTELMSLFGSTSQLLVAVNPVLTCGCHCPAGMAELADAADSKSAGTWYLGGSTPPPGTSHLVLVESLNSGGRSAHPEKYVLLLDHLCPNYA